MSEKSSNSLTCSRALEWLHLLLDTELSSGDHEKLLAHLQTCERCSAAQRELSMIEAAHPELDARLTATPKDYFATLPQQVMARIENAQASHAQPRTVKLQQPHTFDWRTFVFGRGKYALAFAAVLALAFVVTRQLRQRESSTTATAVMKQSDLPSLSRAEAPALEESSLPSEAPAANEPSFALLAEDTTAHFEVAAEVDTNSSVAASGFAAGSSSEGESIALADDSSQMALHAAIPPSRASSDTTARPSSLLADAPQFVANPQAGRAEVFVESRDGMRSEAAQEPSALMRARPPATRLALRTAAEESGRLAESASLPASDARLSQTLSASAQAATQAERLKIWQAYFSESQRDSASYTAAVENLARRLATLCDSSSSVTQLQEALSFYQAMETILASRGGQVAYDREKARLEGLLNRKKPVQP